MLYGNRVGKDEQKMQKFMECAMNTSESKLSTIIMITNCNNFGKNKRIKKLLKFEYFHQGMPCLIML
jgi:hypothetical protein